MPQANSKLPQTPNNEWQDAQYPFDGAWMPDMDPALIGPRNFATLLNMRYNDKSIEGVSGYTKVNTTAIGTYVNILSGIHLRSDKTTRTYNLVHAVSSLGQGRVYQNTTAIGSQGDFDATSRLDTAGNAYFADAATALNGRFSAAPQGSVAYCNGRESMIYSGFEQDIAAAFLQQDDTTAGVKDKTEAINSVLTADYLTLPDGAFDELVILTTRPAQGFKFYVGTANANASTMTVKYWDGNSWETVANGSDGTAAGGKTLAQTGSYTFDHTYAIVSLKHYQELYLYAYKVTIDSGTPTVYHITYDPAFQSIKNVWDGVYRQPIQFQTFSTDHYEDFTLQVNQSSDINVPIGGQLDGLVTGTDYLYVMFEQQMAAIKFTMLGGLVNKVAATAMTVQYWTGSAWATVSNAVDGTSVGAISLAQSGTVSWTPNAAEQKQTQFGSLGYMYKIYFDKTLTGTKGSTAEVLVDICAGIPLLQDIKPFDFSVQFKNRLMLGSFSAGGEGNRMDYSAPNAPDVFNGSESSDDGMQSLYFGGVESIRGAAQVYNRFGASVFAMLMVFKDTEVYMLVGDTADDFQIYPVSLVVGCPAPLTIATTEVSMEGGENYTRNFVIWLSHAGPMMFDGAVITPIKGVENYFDPNNAEYVNWDYITKSRGWVDQTYKEYNLLIPTGSSTDPDVWIVYDLMKRKWFRKDTGTARFPQSGWNVMDPLTGEQQVYGGVGSGTVMRLEYGTSWDGAGITQRVRTGDFWPSNNIWDYTVLRKFKIICKKISSTTTYNLNVYYYGDTESDAGQSVIFEDSDASIGINVDFTDTTGVEFAEAVTVTTELTLDVGLQRVVRKIIDLNYGGWCHAFQMEVTTTDVNKAFYPIAFGLRYRVERKDDTAN